MTVTFYNSTSDKRKLSKSISQLASVDCKLKDNCSLLRPTIIIDRKKLIQYAKCNYMYIPTFNRFYFAKVTALYGDFCQVDGEVDVLMSYANSIRSLYCTVSRQEYKFNSYIVDKLLPVRATKNIQWASIGTYNAGTGIYLTVDGGSQNE